MRINIKKMLGGALRTVWQGLFAKTRFQGIIFARSDVPSVLTGYVVKFLPYSRSDKERDEFKKFMRTHSDVIVVTTVLSNDMVLYAFHTKNVLALVTTSGSLLAHGAIVANEGLQLPGGERKVFICAAKGVSRHLVIGDQVRIELHGDTGHTAIVEKINSP